MENAILTVDRLLPLYQQKAASKKDLDNAISDKMTAEASLLCAKAQLLDNQINLEYTTIRSPIKGAADKAKLRVGALINPGANSLLTTVSVLDPIWVYFTISDNDIIRATKETEDKSMLIPPENELVIEVIFSDGSVFPYKGKVDFSSPTYDRSTGTIQARAVFPNPKYDLRPGQFGGTKYANDWTIGKRSNASSHERSDRPHCCLC